jgi:hypothetical protein
MVLVEVVLVKLNKQIYGYIIIAKHIGYTLGQDLETFLLRTISLGKQYCRIKTFCGRFVL